MSAGEDSVPTTTHGALTAFHGRAGDHNDRAMAGARILGSELARYMRAGLTRIGQSRPALSANWETELTAALPELRRLANRYDTLLAAGARPVTAVNRCAVALATLPVVARHRPDACVVWLDAHADLHTPATSESGYLGGMVLAGAGGLWDSGLGDGLALGNVVLGGLRDVDEAERRLLSEGTISAVSAGEDIVDKLRAAVAGRPVYFHLDCDVFEPGVLATDYRVPGGLTLDRLHEVAGMLAEHELVGVELGEFETIQPTGETDTDAARRLVEAVAPLLDEPRG
ncbi:arginase [Actinopolyspora erythraea]|uniref:Arginase n=1 Tax=Actinopolyspora erythraea TaxID=414996 RepID=A0A099D2L8_9ACTN|nr:arginase family protein [Actinopolyspora erythraea]ASU77467.1 arginase [Actinopolyspora erythraea]KGI80319.1 arginase [Actinopolyspora erythraea]